MKRIDLNVDVGEGFGFDSELLSIATSANVCCGFHAGSETLSRNTVELCAVHGVRVGAHPGVPDRESMGRAKLPPLTPESLRHLRESVLAQVALLEQLGAVYVKPHGELYNASADREDVGELLAEVLRRCGMPLMGLPRTLHEAVADVAGVPLIREGFVDRTYDSRGRLVSRATLGSVVTELTSVVENSLALADRVDSLCVHGDTPGCVEIAFSVREALHAAGYEVGP